MVDITPGTVRGDTPGKTLPRVNLPDRPGPLTAETGQEYHGMAPVYRI